MNIYIKPVEACNLRCAHCYNGEPNNDKLPIDQKLKGFVSELIAARQDKENWIIFHGGEPLLADEEQLREMAAIEIPNAKKRVTTNLTVPLTPARIKFLLAMDDIRTSFDIGIGRFSNIGNIVCWIHNIKKLRDMGGRLSTLNICLTIPLLAHYAGEIAALAVQLGFTTLSFEHICMTGRATDDIIPWHEECDIWLSRLYEALWQARSPLQVRNFEDIRLGILGEHEQRRSQFCCKSTLTINADGTVGECPNSARINIIGTTDSDPQELLKNKCQSCNKVFLAECLACEFYQQCRGGCREQQWMDGVCAYPKKLAKMIEEMEF